MKRYFVALALVLFLGIAVEIYTSYRNVFPSTGETSVVFLRPGLSVREVGKQLKRNGVLVFPWQFEALVRLQRKQSKIKPGEYLFELPSSPAKVLRQLLDGKGILHRVTFPEGLTMEEMITLLETQKLVSGERMRTLVKESRKFQVPGPTLEGFLFPDTYFFSKLDGETKIIETMLAHFRQALRPEDMERAKQLGFDLLAWTTFASIVEKESGQAIERPMVSSVFHNRLKKKMRLQSDPTVIYGIANFNGNLTKKDLQTPTLYNTYTTGGLPPGPICNPGADALRAAVNPAKSNYFYFVSRRDGTHIFAETYEEHAKNVERFQIARSKAH